MDDQAKRVCVPLMRGWAEFENDAASLLDLRLAEQASDALDNASAPRPQLLRAAASDLEYAYYTERPGHHQQVGRQILSPVRAETDN
ncbi:hypothetical protein ABN028_34675 [Actinopolymorpha sp. B17G11]|uniref:hypothetical protein n=1 Tax=Actinopolymorpha sp. B17G11 TaxID=3160861 RepID=UPI0032E4BCA0